MPLPLQRRVLRKASSTRRHSTEPLEVRALLAANLSLFQNVVVDSTDGDSIAEEAIDGIVSGESRWASASSAGPHWLEVQLQAPYPVGSAQLYLGNAWGNAVEDFDVQYHDGYQWQTVASVRGDNSTDHNLVFENVVDTATRYRIYTTADSLSVKEFVLLPPNDGNEHPMGTGVDLNLASKRSPETTSTLGTNYSINATDGYASDDSAWRPSDGAGPHQVEFELERVLGVRSLHLYTGNSDGTNALSNFEVEFLHSSGEYRPIPNGSTTSSGSIDAGVVTEATSNEVVINFAWAVSTDHIRVSSSDSNVMIREAVVLPENTSGDRSYPIGTSVQFVSPPATTFTDYEDAWYQLVSRQNSQALIADEGGATQAAIGVGDAAKYQVLYSYSLDAFRIRAKDSGLALQVEDASQQAGAAIVEGEYSAAPHQLWRLQPTDAGYFQIVNVWSGMVLHTDAGDPSVVTQQPLDEAANPADNVEWQIDFVEDYFKKGTATTINGRYGGSWWYNWNRLDFPEAPNDQFYTPMQWGKWWPGFPKLHEWYDNWNDELKPAYLLGFNEPDSAKQADTSVERAIELWPRLEAMDIPLVGPSQTFNTAGRNWHNEFTDAADDRGYRQDYGGAHWYAGPNVNQVMNHVNNVYNWSHGRKVWLTEFSAVDWSNGSGNWSEETNYNFILEFMYRADRNDKLAKYSLFMWAGDQPATPWERSNPRGNTFIGDTVGGELTPYGKAYAGWDGKSAPELDTLYIIHNRAAYHRLQNDSTDNVNQASIRFDDTSVQWIFEDAGNGEVFITSPLDGRRVELSGGNIVMSPAGATGASVRWRFQHDSQGWHKIIHANTGNYLRLNRTNNSSGAPTSMSLDVVSPTSDNNTEWWFVKPYQELNLTLDNSSIAETGTATATLTTTLVTATDKVVTLSVDDASVVSVPPTVTIPAGQSSVTFNVSAVDDDSVDGPQFAFITADADAVHHGLVGIEVTDDDLAELTLTIAEDSISENGGTSQATVTRNTPNHSDLVVTLSSSDTGEATVPATVTIPAGATFATFTVSAVDDSDADGTQAVTISATATDHAAATGDIDIADNEFGVMLISLAEASVSEVGTVTGTIEREGDSTAALVVSLFSSDTDEATVPASVTIPAGQASTTFTVSGVDDEILDPAATVTLTATAAAYDDATTDIVVEDILNHRMSQLTVIVQDQHGNPLPDATVDVSMTQHGFTFGTQVHDRILIITQPEFDGLTTGQKHGLIGDWNQEETTPVWQDVLNYRDRVWANFNHIIPTNGIQWIQYRNTGPVFLDPTIEEAYSRGATVTGHATVWGNDGWPTPNEFRPDANPDPQVFFDALIDERLSTNGVMARFSDAGAGPNIIDWDVLNEPLHEHHYANTFVNAGFYANATEFQADVFRRAHAVRPDAVLAINDYNIITSNNDNAARQFRDQVNAVNAELAGEAASIEVIKVQAHTWLTLTKEAITRRLDILAETGLPIVISEFDMRDDSGQLSPQEQETTFRNFLEAAFEHPAVTGFSMWGIWDPGHWRGNAPLFNDDWTAKDEAAPWFDLVQGDWKSELLSQPVDANARWTNELALFDGLYEITATSGLHSETVTDFDLSEDRELTITVTMSDPELTVSIAADSISEGAGSAATTGTVTRTGDTTDELVVTLSSSDDSEATVPATVTIPAGASVATFDVAGVDDSVADGTQAVLIGATAIGFNGAELSIDVTDDEIAGFIVTETDESTTTHERGTSDTVSVVLSAQPEGDVVIDVTSADENELISDLQQLTFTPDNWDVAQVVEVSAVDDETRDGDQETDVTFAVNDEASSDPFDALSDQIVVATSADDDDPAFVFNNNLFVVGTDEDDTASVVEDEDEAVVIVNGEEFTFPISAYKKIIVSFHDGDDSLDASAAGTKLLASMGNGGDTVLGTSAGDSIRGGNGLDSIIGNDGDDTIKSGAGADTLEGNAGHDDIGGSGGGDLILGGSGHDILRGGGGLDSINGGGGADTLNGGGKSDTLNGDSGPDLLIGGRGADELRGGSGDDLIEGDNGNDVLEGEDGRDLLVGGKDKDTIAGGDGEDILIAGTTDLNRDALKSILAEWLSDRSHAQRLSNVRGAEDRTADRLNTESLVGVDRADETQTVFDDELRDHLSGEADDDVFFASLGDRLRDKVETEWLELL